MAVMRAVVLSRGRRLPTNLHKCSEVDNEENEVAHRAHLVFVLWRTVQSDAWHGCARETIVHGPSPMPPISFLVIYLLARAWLQLLGRLTQVEAALPRLLHEAAHVVGRDEVLIGTHQCEA